MTEVIDELKTLHRSENPRQAAGNRPFPLMIPAGDGSSIIINDNIDRTISHITLRIRENNPDVKTTHTLNEWNKLIRKQIGLALTKISLETESIKNAEFVLKCVNKAVRQEDGRISSCEYVFGCTLFGGDPVSPFSIGPVRFEFRNGWLERQVAASSLINSITRRRLLRAWDEKKIRPRKPSMQSSIEDQILEVVRSCPYIVSVTTDGLAQEAGLAKSLDAARLALTSIALLWRTPSSALKGFNLSYDRAIYHQRYLALREGGGFFSRSSLPYLPSGPWLNTGEWDKIFADWQGGYTVVGEILDYVVNPKETTRPKLMNVLAQAMLWFHEGCREHLALMAVVNFAASMDAIAGGGREAGIRRLINARLRLMDDDPVNNGGPTMKSVIKRIYANARSRTIHGTNDEFGHDWSSTKGYAEQFAKYCLIAAINWAADNPKSDDPALLTQQ